MLEEGEWTWKEGSGEKQDYLTIILARDDRSVAVVLPRPRDWGVRPAGDQALIRRFLRQAAGSSWHRI